MRNYKGTRVPPRGQTGIATFKNCSFKGRNVLQESKVMGRLIGGKQVFPIHVTICLRLLLPLPSTVPPSFDWTLKPSISTHLPLAIVCVPDSVRFCGLVSLSLVRKGHHPPPPCSLQEQPAQHLRCVPCPWHGWTLLGEQSLR